MCRCHNIIIENETNDELLIDVFNYCRKYCGYESIYYDFRLILIMCPYEGVNIEYQYPIVFYNKEKYIKICSVGFGMGNYGDLIINKDKKILLFGYSGNSKNSINDTRKPDGVYKIEDFKLKKIFFYNDEGGNECYKLKIL